MKRLPRASATLALVGALLSAACAHGAGAATRRPPNLVVVLVDDLGWRDVSTGDVRPAEPLVGTPAVDRLAREGMVFTSAWASAPVCTPTRTSLMTGRCPARTHITYWTLHAGRDTTAAWPGLRWPAWNVDGLQPGDVTLPALLAGAGYRTIHVGKAHLGAVGTPGGDPRALGFDVNIAGHGAGAPASYRGLDGFADGSVWDVPGLERWKGRDVFLTEALAAEADAQVRAAVAEGRPFLLHFAPYAVHTPITADPRFVGRFAERDPREAAYASMIAAVDAALAQLLDTLDELGVSDDTLVVFTSDNGGLAALARGLPPHEANAPLRSGKGSAYEGGLAVPWVVRWPGVVRPGTRCDTAVVTHDLFPTLLAAAGVPPPGDARDGVDLRPLLDGTGALPARDIVVHQPHFWGVAGPGIAPFSALRRGDEKLVWWHATGTVELYDLAADRAEAHDLARERPERAAELARALRDGLEALGAQRPVVAVTGEPVPWPAAEAGAPR